MRKGSLITLCGRYLTSQNLSSFAQVNERAKEGRKGKVTRYDHPWIIYMPVFSPKGQRARSENRDIRTTDLKKKNQCSDVCKEIKG